MDNKNMDDNNDLEKVNFAELPTGKNEDVEFSEELADEADRKAMERAAAADERNEEQ
ncbi:YfhD family protein [Paenibacillus arenilitoris]|uniref:YfhD family protein n=1 Tax=Paenibacillus arenilitoris TaxID=2772299 RepID=A0A927H7C8_9BACL|nr:YfhD family protein [Paenibacillus arenilitoris]MBD2869464.1 YfhD family protein [Paenibacillus arenilitoris]